GRGRAVAVERAVVEPASRGHGMARPQRDPVALAQPADRRLPGRDPGAAEIEPVLRAGEGAKIAAPADPLARLDDGPAQPAGAQLAGGRRAGETGADDQDIAGFFRHSRSPAAIVIRRRARRQRNSRRREMALDSGKTSTGGGTWQSSFRVSIW